MIDPAEAFNAREIAGGKITPAHLAALARLWQAQHGLEVDGKIGDQTRHSIESEAAPQRPSEPEEQRAEWSRGFSGPLKAIPSDRPEIYATFGDPGTAAQPNKAWFKQNIIEARNMPGVPPKWYFQCHKLAEPYFREGFRRAQLSSKISIGRAGCYNLRHIQDNPAKQLSLHSWGIAVDIDPALNSARTFARGAGPDPWSDEWRKIWPGGVDRPFVEAMESVGFTWGGVWGTSGGDFNDRARRCSFFDPMHFELCVR